MAQRFFQRPIVDAKQWTGGNYEGIRDWIHGFRHDVRAADGPVCLIFTDGDTLGLQAGDQHWSAVPGCWVVLAPYGWSVWSEHAFASAHEPVEEIE